MNASEAIEMSRFLQLLSWLSLSLFLFFEGSSNNYGDGLADELRPHHSLSDGFTEHKIWIIKNECFAERTHVGKSRKKMLRIGMPLGR